MPTTAPAKSKLVANTEGIHQPNGKRAEFTRRTARTYTHVLIGRDEPGKEWGVYCWSGSLELCEKQRRTWRKRQPLVDLRIIPVLSRTATDATAATKVKQDKRRKSATTSTVKTTTKASKTINRPKGSKEAIMATKTKNTNSNVRKDAARKAGKCQLCGTKTKGHSVTIDYESGKVTKSAAGKAKQGHAFYCTDCADKKKKRYEWKVAKRNGATAPKRNRSKAAKATAAKKSTGKATPRKRTAAKKTAAAKPARVRKATAKKTAPKKAAAAKAAPAKKAPRKRVSKKASPKKAADAQPAEEPF